MSASDDRPDEMFGDDELDTDFDMLLDGVAIDPRLVPLTRIVDDVHIVAGGPPPSPTVELAAVLRGDLVADEDLSPGAASAGRTARRCAPPSPRPASRQRSLARIPSRLGAMSLAAKVALGLAMAGAGAVGAGVAGVLPDPAADVVRRAVEAVTPFELPEAGADGRDDQGAETSANAEPDQIDPGTANTEVTVDDAAGPEAGRAGTPSEAPPLRSADRPDDAEPANAPATRESVAEGEHELEAPIASATPGPPSGGGKPTGGHVPSDGGPSSGGGSDSPSQAAGSPGNGPPGDARPPSAAEPPAGAGPPASTGARPEPGTTPAPSRQQNPPPRGAPAGAASSPTAGSSGGGPAGDAPGSAPDGAPPAAQPPGAGPPPAPGR
jgi:hypothetical protein